MSAPYSSQELMACVMARAFRDGEVVVMGAVPALPLAACRLAKALHAPSLAYIVGGSGTVNPAPAALTPQSCDPELHGGPVTLPLHEVVLLEGRGGALDVFCAGGLQIDAYGNCNLAGVGDPARPKLRGPGSVGLPFLPAVERTVIFTLAHNPRTLVERVDFVSGPGDTAELVVTPLATLDVDPETRRLRLASVHPGVGAEDVRAQTGFELTAPEPVPETPPPTAEELAVLAQIDPAGLLRA
ncbi:MAG: CoA synthetase [Thermoleophilia bacterium]|nr:CoA synthetase [Thermoleophilia bacterium]